MTSTPPSPDTAWRAPRADGPVRGVVDLPGSKSLTNRLLLLAALSEGTSTLARPLRSRDTLLMAAALRALGVRVADVAADAGSGEPAWQVHGVAGPWQPPAAGDGPVAVDVGNAGTVARFLPPAASLVDGDVAFDGDARVRERPLGPLVQAMRALGVALSDGGRGALPLTVHGRGRLPGGAVELDASASCQLVSALLLAAPRADAAVRVTATGAVPSGPHLAMTVEVLRERGAAVDVADGDRGRTWTVQPGPLAARDVEVEPDLSSAAPFLASAVVTGGEVRVRRWPARTTQPGAQLPDLLAAFGATATRDGADLVVRGPDRLTGGLDADLSDVGELTPVLAAVAALSDAPSRLRGVAHLRGQETDRLAALATELNRLGGDVTETADGLEVHPRPLRGGLFRTYDDHRLVMAGAVLGLAVDGVTVEDVATAGKTLPGFDARWEALVSGSAG